ncbi:MAG: hypothetical protein JO197_04555 [Acidobacteria bacterium]|nr:hypothetical protein [Acidobacteriota bacterium]MBV9475274.1 hypothetical protein [Acidobacteriota bacterium]
MIRSILPSKARVGARFGKRFEKRRVRHAIRAALRAGTFDADLRRDADLSTVVWWRRTADKLHPFMRWCRARTAGMTPEEALGYVRGLLPRNLIGDHAYGHWEAVVRPYMGRLPTVRTRLDVGTLCTRLRAAYERDPSLVGMLNAAIKSRIAFDEPRRLLFGVHDIDAFARDALRRGSIELDCAMAIMEEIEGRPNGRPSHFRAA